MNKAPDNGAFKYLDIGVFGIFEKKYVVEPEKLIGMDRDIKELKKYRDKYGAVVLADAFSLPFKLRSFRAVFVPCFTCLVPGKKFDNKGGCLEFAEDYVKLLRFYVTHEVAVKFSCNDKIREEIEDHMLKTDIFVSRDGALVHFFVDWFYYEFWEKSMREEGRLE